MKNKIFLRAKHICAAAILCLMVNSLSVFASSLENFAVNVASPRRISGFERTEREIFAMVNEQRRRSNLPELEWDAELAHLARAYSKTMADEGFFDHFDSNGGTVVQRAEKARVKNWTKIGENLFYCENLEEFSRVAVRGWMKSPTHRDNILDPEWNRSGIGIYEASENQIYVTQVFIER